MQPDAEHKVVYRAVADFSALDRAVARSMAQLAALRAAGAQIGPQRGGGGGQVATDMAKQLQQSRDLTAATNGHRAAADGAAASNGKQTQSIQGVVNGTQRLSTALSKAGTEQKNLVASVEAITPALSKATNAVSANTAATDKGILSSKTFVRGFQAQIEAMNKAKVAARGLTEAVERGTQAHSPDKDVLNSRTFVRGFMSQIDAMHKAKADEEAAQKRATALTAREATKAADAVIREAKRATAEIAKEATRAAKAAEREATRAVNAAEREAKRTTASGAREATRAAKVAGRTVVDSGMFRQMFGKQATVVQKDITSLSGSAEGDRGLTRQVAMLAKAKAEEEAIRKRATATAEREAKKAANAVEREAKREAAAVEREAKRSAAAFSKNVRGFADEFVLMFRGVSRGLRTAAHDAHAAETVFGRVRARAAAIKAEFSSGGGSANIGGRFFNELGDMADRTATRLGKAGRAMLSFRGLMVLAVAAAGPLIAAVGSLAAGGIGLVDTLISLSGALFALPALFGAAATSAVALFIAIKPLKDVFTAYTATQKAAHRTSQQFIASQNEERRAQVSLNEARKQATRDLEDLRSQLDRTGLDESEARLRVKRAIADYQRVRADPGATSLDREEAANRVKETQFDYNDTLTKNKRTVEDYNQAVKRGVEGNPAVVSAVENLTKALKEQAAGGSEAYTAQQNLEAALAKLGPNSRAVALALLGQAGAWTSVKKAIGERFFGPLVSQLGHLPGLLIIIKTLLGEAAGAVGDVMAKGIAMISRPEWKRDLTAFAKDNGYVIRTLGDAVWSIVDAMRNITMAAAPFTRWLVSAVAGVAKAFDDWSGSARRSGDIAKFLDGTRHSLHDLWEILKNLSSLFGSLFGASQDFATSMLDGIVAVTDKWAAWGKKQEGHGSSFKNWLTNTKPLLHDVMDLLGAIAIAFGQIAADPKNIDEAKKILGVLAHDVLPAIVGIFHDLSESHAISDVISALGNFLKAIKNFLDNGGALPITIFVATFLSALTLLADALSNPVLAGGFKIFLGFLASLAAASAIGKFLGLFKLYDLFRKFKPPKTAFGRTVDKVLGGGSSSATGAASASAAALDGAAAALDSAAAVWRVVAGTFETAIQVVSARLTGAGAVLLRAGEALIAAAEVSAGRGALPLAATSGARNILTPASTRGAVNLASPAAGAAAEEGAAVSLRGSALALDGAAEQLIIAAGVLREAGLLGGIPLGGKAKAATRAAEREAVAVAEGGALAKGGSWLSRLFGRGSGVAAGAAGAAGVAEAAAPRLLPRILAGAVRGVMSPLSLIGLGVGLLADSGALGKPKSGLATSGRALGAIATGAGIGAGIGSIVPGVGTAIGAGVGAAAGAVYSFVKDPQLRKDVGNFFGMIGGFFKEVGVKAWQWFDTHVVHPVVHFFVEIGGFFGNAGNKIWQWFDNNVIHPVVSFFVTIGQFVGKVASTVGTWVDDHLIQPVVRFFTGIGTAIGNFAKNVGSFVYAKFIRPILAIFIGVGIILFTLLKGLGALIYDHVVRPVGHFFAAVGLWIGRHVAKIPGWIYDHVVLPVVHFFATVGLWIGRHAKDIGVWIYDNVIVPVVDFFVTVGLWIGRHAAEIGTWIYDNVVSPVIDFFKTVGLWIGRHAAEIGTWIYDHVVSPVIDFFIAVGDFFGGLIDRVGAWVDEHVIQPIFDFFGAIGDFFVNLPSRLEKWLESLPGPIGAAFRTGFNVLPGKDHLEGRASGGLIAGTADGRTDTKQIMATIGEFVIRKRVVDQPGAKRLLHDLNEGRLDPASFYAGLGASTHGATVPTSRRVGASTATTVTNTNTRNAGMSVGDVTINNPVRERSDRSLRRTLHTLAYMSDH